MTTSNASWLHHALALIEADYQRSADTHLNLPTYHDAAWVQQNLGDCAGALERIHAQLA